MTLLDGVDWIIVIALGITVAEFMKDSVLADLTRLSRFARKRPGLILGAFGLLVLWRFVRPLLIIAVLFVAATPLYAQDAIAPDAPNLTLATRIAAAGMAADWISTAYCVRAVGCYEANPLLSPIERHAGSPAMLAVAAGTDMVILWAVNRFIGRTHPHIAKAILFSTAIVGLTLAVRNVHNGINRRQYSSPSEVH